MIVVSNYKLNREIKIFNFFKDKNKNEILKILESIRITVKNGEDSLYGDKEKVLKQIEKTISSPRKRNIEKLFFSTGNIQELSVDNSWSDKFIQFSEKSNNLL